MGGKKRLSRAERRAQLIDVAADAFLAGGFEGTSMDDIARAAGVTRLIVYRNFESKADLYRAVLDSVLVKLGEAFASSDLPMQDAVRVMLPVARSNAAAFQLLWRDAGYHTPFRDRSDFLRAQVYEGARVALQPYVADPVRLEWAARSGGAHLVECICAWIDVGRRSQDQEAVEMIRRGLSSLAEAWSDRPEPVGAGAAPSDD